MLPPLYNELSDSQIEAIVDACLYRMLTPREVLRAQAFDDDYIVTGTKDEQVKQIGNAVSPPAAEWLLTRGLPLLDDVAIEQG